MSIFSAKHSLAQSGLLTAFTDCHSHILPDVDDGVQSMDDTLAVLAYYEQAGIGEVWMTPHIMEDIPNAPSTLRARFAKVQEAYGGPIKLHLAAENMLDSLFDQRLAAGDLLPWGERGDALLVETSYYRPPTNLYGQLDAIRHKGFHPILAHPERYAYMSDTDYRRLRELGVRFQCNITSFTGHYGPQALKRANMLLERGWVEYLGSDLHHLASFKESMDAKALSKKTLRLLESVMNG